MPNLLVTGSSRGLGLEWCRQYAQAGWRVFATCRAPAEAQALLPLAQQHPALSIHRLDVTRAEDVQTLAEELRGEAIDVLINNAGLYLEAFDAGLPELDFQAWEETFQVNTMGALRVTRAFREHVGRSDHRLIIAMSTRMASTSELSRPGSYPYRSTKAALNTAMKGVSLELKEDGIGVLLLHPGWVRTRMGGPQAPLEPEDSVRQLRARVAEFDLRQSGRFLRYDGSELPW